MKGFLGFAVVGAIAVTAGALAAERQISEESVRSAIESFLQNPTAPSEQVNTIVMFSVESDAVKVVIDTDVCCTWLRADKKYEHAGLLLVAFTAGNVRSQLDSGVCRDDPYSGLIAVFRVYRHLKQANPALTIPEVEKLLELHRQGKLTEHLAKEKARAATGKKQEN